MAGGKQSPRQRMVNLMYLVFIAMLAMNMSKEVLSAFGSMNEKLAESNKRTTKSNQASYDALAQKASEQAKQYGKAKEDTDKLRVIADDLYNYIEDLKTKMTADLEDKKAYEAMDKSGFLDQYFFANGKVSKKGKEFVEKIKKFRLKALGVLGNTDLSNVVEIRFNTEDVKDKEGIKKSWLSYNFEGFPLIASLTKMTQIQSDIKTTESDALATLLQGELTKAVSMKNYEAMVIFEKNAYYPGENLSGKIVLGKNDPNLTADKVIVNGNQISQDKIKAGQVILDGPAGEVGDKDLKGTFFFKEGNATVEIPIKGGYSVIPKPNEAVISADKMNVVYRGLTNPLTISIPGISGNKIEANAPGLSRLKGNSYAMRPRSGDQVLIKVSGKLPDGTPVSSSKRFRIKDIPPANGMVRNQFGTVRMPKTSVSNITVGAGLPDFLFDLKLNVTSFSIKIPGEPAIKISGRRLNARAKKSLAKAKRNDLISIFDIKATVSGSNYKLKKVLPVNIEITN